jgi:hypothetical protein
VQPVIDAQDARETFDMRTYGQRILSRLLALSLEDGSAEPVLSQQQQLPLSEQDQQQPQQHAKRKKGHKGAALQKDSGQQTQQQVQQQRTIVTAPLAAAIGDPEQWQVSRWAVAVLGHVRGNFSHCLVSSHCCIRHQLP